MRVIRLAGTFALTSATLVLGIDAALSLGYLSPPTAGNSNQFLLTHGLFHAAVLVLSFAGAIVGFLVLKNAAPTVKATAWVAGAYGLVTAFAGPSLFLLAGAVGAAAWLVLGSASFALGSGILAKPWRRPPAE